MNENAEPHVVAHEQESDDEYGAKVQRRIGKEVSKRKAAEDLVAQARADAKAAREDADKYQERIVELESARIDRTKTDVKKELQQAIEDGDTEKQADLMARMADTHAEDREFSKAKADRAKGNGEEPPPGANGGELPPVAHPSATSFVKRNVWFSSNELARKRAMEIESTLLKDEGYELGDDLYEELESRLFEENPELEDDPGMGEEDPAPVTRENHPPVTRHVAPVAPANRGVGRRRNRGGNHMTEAARQSMAKYGLNPDNPDHVKGYLKHRKG